MKDLVLNNFLVPNNIDFAFSCPNCILNLLLTNLTQARKISN